MVIVNVFPKFQTIKNFVRPLCKKRRFGGRFESQHVKVSQKFAKSASDRFYQVSPPFQEKLISKMSPILLGEIIGMFLNKLTAEGKYHVQYSEKLQLSIEMQFKKRKMKNEKLFLNFLFHLWNLHQISNILKKN